MQYSLTRVHRCKARYRVCPDPCSVCRSFRGAACCGSWHCSQSFYTWSISNFIVVRSLRDCVMKECNYLSKFAFALFGVDLLNSRYSYTEFPEQRRAHHDAGISYDENLNKSVATHLCMQNKNLCSNSFTEINC